MWGSTVLEENLENINAFHNCNPNFLFHLESSKYSHKHTCCYHGSHSGEWEGHSFGIRESCVWCLSSLMLSCYVMLRNFKYFRAKFSHLQNEESINYTMFRTIKMYVYAYTQRHKLFDLFWIEIYFGWQKIYGIAK